MRPSGKMMMRPGRPLERAARGGLSFLVAPALSESGAVEHAFMTRKGGVSPAPFNTLNLGHGTEDAPSNINSNMGRISRAFGLWGGVFTARQVHGRDVVIIEGAPEERDWRPAADAIITAKRGLAIGVLTADCLPVLLFDPLAGVAAAVHAGWRGLAAGVTEETFRVMKERFGSRAAHTLAAMGPHIGPCCYEVSEDIAEGFRERGREAGPYLNRETGRLCLDLGSAMMDALLGLGVAPEGVSGPGPCTVCNEGEFFSYRRDGETGRQMSFIMIR